MFGAERGSDEVFLKDHYEPLFNNAVETMVLDDDGNDGIQLIDTYRKQAVERFHEIISPFCLREGVVEKVAVD